MRRLADQVGILTLGSAAAVAVQLGVGIVLARLFPAETFGSYLQVTMLVATVSPILYLGIPSGLYYFLPAYTDGRREAVLVQAVGLLVLLGLCGAGALAAAARPLAAALNNADLAPAVARYGLALVGMLPAAVAHPLLVAMGRYRAATLVAAGTALADGAVTVGAALLGADLASLALSVALVHLGVGAAVAGLVAAVVSRRPPRLAQVLDGGLLAAQLRYAVPFAASTHVGTIGRFLDRYIIGAFYPPALFAVYAVGARQVPVVPLVLQSIGIVLQQRFTALVRDGRTAEVLPLWREAVRGQALLVLPLAVMLFVFAAPVVTLLYGERYLASVPIFRVYLLLLALRIGTWPLVLTATGRTHTLLAGSVLSLLVSAGASLILVLPMGLLGPALGAACGPLAAAVFYVRRTAAVLGVSSRSLVPWREVGLIAAVAVAAALPVWPFASRVGDPLVVGLSAAGYAVVLVGLAGHVGVLRRADLAVVGRWLRRRPGEGGCGPEKPGHSRARPLQSTASRDAAPANPMAPPTP